MTISSLDVFLSHFDPVSCSMSHFQCCFITSIHISQEAGKVVWYPHLFKNFPQFVVIHTGKVFSIVNEAEVDAFLEFFCFFYDPTDVCNLITSSSQFSRSVMSDSLLPNGLQDTRPRYPSPTPGIYSDSCPLSQ